MSVLNVSLLVGILPCIFLFSKAGKIDRITYLLAQLAQTVLGNIGPRSFLYRPCCAWSYVLQRPPTNISQYSPGARLVTGYSCSMTHNFAQCLTFRVCLCINYMYLCSHFRVLIFTLSLAGFQSVLPLSETVQHSMRVCILIGS